MTKSSLPARSWRPLRRIGHEVGQRREGEVAVERAVDVGQRSPSAVQRPAPSCSRVSERRQPGAGRLDLEPPRDPAAGHVEAVLEQVGLGLDAELHAGGEDAVVADVDLRVLGQPLLDAAARPARASQAEDGHEALLVLALDPGDDLDVLGQRRAAQLLAQALVDLEDARRCWTSRSRRAPPCRRRPRCAPRRSRRPRSSGCPGGRPRTPRASGPWPCRARRRRGRCAPSTVSGRPRRAVRDHRVHRLGDDDRALGLGVDARSAGRRACRR